MNIFAAVPPGVFRAVTWFSPVYLHICTFFKPMMIELHVEISVNVMVHVCTARGYRARAQTIPGTSQNQYVFVNCFIPATDNHPCCRFCSVENVKNTGLKT